MLSELWCTCYKIKDTYNCIGLKTLFEFLHVLHLSAVANTFKGANGMWKLCKPSAFLHISHREKIIMPTPPGLDDYR